MLLRRTLCRLLMASLLMLVLATPAQSARLPPLPSWARGPDYRGPNQWKDFAIKQNGRNHEVILAANRARKRWDFLLYGDSITQLIYRESKEEWARLFPNASWLAAPMGVSGNDIEDLAWRLIRGSEKPSLAPRCIALLIGSNNVNNETPLDKIESYMDYILRWLRAAFPETKILLINILPRAKLNTRPANRRLHALAVRRKVAWSTCGNSFDPSDPAQLYDGTHPTLAMQTKLLRCLAPIVAKLAGKDKTPPPPRARRLWPARR